MVQVEADTEEPVQATIAISFGRKKAKNNGDIPVGNSGQEEEEEECETVLSIGDENELCFLHTKNTTGDLLRPGNTLKDMWKVVKLLDRGAFGQVYSGVNIRTGDQVGLKAESIHQPRRMLQTEVAVLRRLNGRLHISRFIDCGRNERFSYMVMQIQGPNLAALRHIMSDRVFSLSTALRLGLQILKAIENIHDCGYVHRDMKPSNLTMGHCRQTRRSVFVVDFGLACRYTVAKGETSKTSFRGTPRYASLNALDDNEVGRVDDLWSLFYVLVEFVSGSLPWRKTKNKDEITQLKRECDHRVLLKRLPPDFKYFLEHLQSLGPREEPDYALLNAFFHRSLQRRGIKESDPYDWERVIYCEKFPETENQANQFFGPLPDITSSTTIKIPVKTKK